MIQLAETDEDILACYEVMAQLRPHIRRETFVQRIRTQEQDHYRLVFAKHGRKVVAVAGFRISRYLAWGKAMYVDDLITSEQSRSKGYGGRLMVWLTDHARQQGCQQLHLDSGVQRHDAHRFYLNQRMKIASYHFMIELSPADNT